MGGTAAAGPPLAVGEGSQRGPPRNRSPLAVSFAAFFGGKESGPPEACRADGMRKGKSNAAAGGMPG